MNHSGNANSGTNSTNSNSSKLTRDASGGFPVTPDASVWTVDQAMHQHFGVAMSATIHPSSVTSNEIGVVIDSTPNTFTTTTLTVGGVSSTFTTPTLAAAPDDITPPDMSTLEKPTEAPSSVSWNNAGGLIPDQNNTVYQGMRLVGNVNFTGATGMHIYSSSGGSVDQIWVVSGELLFNYTTPERADIDVLVITGTDKDGNPIEINHIVELPY